MRTNDPPLLEPATAGSLGSGPYGQAALAAAARNRRRLAIFVTVFLLSSAVSLTYVFWRPAVYESLSVLNILPAAVEDEAGNSEQQMALQMQMLTSRQLLSQLGNQVAELPGFRTSPVFAGTPLSDLLTVDSPPESSIVELRARGAPPEFLTALVNIWLDRFLEIHEERRQSASLANTQVLLAKQAEIEEVIEKKHAELDRFRREHEIVSLEREENQILAQQRGMAKALTNAREEVVAAKAELDAIKQAVAEGQSVVKQEDSRTLANLENRAEYLRALMLQYSERYTSAYMNADPDIIAVRKNLEEIEAELRARSKESQDIRIAEAEHAYAAARRKLAGLREKMTGYQQLTLEFNTKFTKYSALKENLVQLETLQRQVQEQLVKAKVAQGKVPEIRILERASLPGSPVYPHYWRDAGIGVLASLVLSLIAVLLHDFFSKSIMETAYPQPWPVFYPVRAGALPNVQRANGSLPPGGAESTPLLQQELPSEMSEAEIASLLELADEGARLLLFALLSGLSLQEAASLDWADVDLDTGNLNVAGPSARTLSMSQPLHKAFADIRGARGTREGSVWEQSDGNSMETASLAAVIGNLAHDAGLSDPGQDMAERISHTYIVFLIRQGARLSELRRITGDIAPANLSMYRIFSPPGAGLPLDQVQTLYPLLS